MARWPSFMMSPRINRPKNSSEICCGNVKPEQKPRQQTAPRTGFSPCSAMSCALPLRPSSPGVELLEQKVNANGEFKGTIEIIRRNIELEARLIDDILDLTAIAKGKINLDIGTVDIHATVRGALEILKTEFAHKNLRIHTNLPA